MIEVVSSSYNVLELQELSATIEDSEMRLLVRPMLMNYIGTFKCRIKYIDPESDKIMVVVNIRCQSRGVEVNVIARECVENFFNKNYSGITTEFYDHRSNCHIDKKRVDAIECNWENDELKDMFMHLFNASNWSMEDKTIEKC